MVRSRGRVTPGQIRRMYVSFAVFWVSVLGLAGSLIGYATGTHDLVVLLVAFGVTGVAGFAVFTGTVASLALGAPGGRPRSARGGVERRRIR